MLLSILLSLNIFATATPDTTSYEMIIGSYTREGNPGIEVFNFNHHTGAVSPSYTIKSSNASYQAYSKDRKFMYSVTEEGAGKSFVSAFKRNALGKYEFINMSSTIGDGPCFVAYRESSKTVYAANYGSGTLSIFKTEQGKLLPIAQHIVYKGSSVNASRQTSPHAHNVVISPDQKELYVVDLGTDKVHHHHLNADGTVNENDEPALIKPGNGPRHIVFSSTGKNAYLINELSGTVDVFKTTNGTLQQIQSIAADTTHVNPKGSGHIQISPNGKWLLTSNRISSNEVTVFAIQPDGKLKDVFHQRVALKPRNFSFDPSGNFVLVGSQDEHVIQVFSFNDKIGSMKDTHQDIKIKSPVCISFVAKQEPDANARLQELGIELVKPGLPMANYVKFTRVGNLIYLAGHGPEKAPGVYVLGRVGKDLTQEEGQEAARLCGLALLSTLKAAVGDLNNVKQVVKVNGYVNSDDSFTQQPFVINGVSNLLVDVFGEKGKHARAAVGVNTLPLNTAVEVEMIVEVK